MKTTIENLWYGDLSPWSEAERHQKEGNELFGLIERHKKDLFQLLGEDGGQILEKHEEAHFELNRIECENAFVKGFSLGVKLVAEALTEN